MKLLQNGCKRSEIKVLPGNWKTTSSVKKPWKIYYRFYCPGLTGKGTRYPKGKLVTNGGMNCLGDAQERRDYTSSMIAVIKRELDIEDFNPITEYKKNILADNTEYEIHPDTPLPEALEAAYNLKKATDGTRRDLRSVLKYTQVAIKNLHFTAIPVKDIRRRHMKAILEQMEIVKNNTIINKKTKERGKWTANNFNFYRSHLMMLFDELCQWETIENNPIDKIRKMKHAIAPRETLTLEQRIDIDEMLRKDNYPFWRFMHIFFHSGARETEMVLVKKEDVNLKDQTVRYKILKGNAYRQVLRPIANNAINLWEQVLIEAGPGQFLFSRGLKPGDKSIRPEQITKRWLRWVKQKCGITADFYSLKHSHSTEASRKIGTRLAALHNQHSEKILKGSYDVEGKERDMEILKGVDISFVPQ